MPSIDVAPVAGARDLAEFVALPKRLYAGMPGYTPPLDMERKDTLTPGKNPYFAHADAQLFVARRDGRVVGRISAQVDRAYLAQYADSTGHFGWIDAEDDPAIFAALLKTAEDWVRARGMTRITGPLSFSINEEVGLQIEGFDTRSMLLVPFHGRWAQGRVEALGYAKLMDVIGYDYPVQTAPETIGRKLIERAGLKGRVKVRTVDMKRFDEEVRTLLDIFNDAWSDNWGYVPFTPEEIATAAKMFKPIVEPKLAIFVEVDGEAKAFILALPNLQEAARGLDGRLLPFGWIKLLWRMKVAKYRTARVPLMGVRREYRNTSISAGLAMMAIDELRRNGKALGVEAAELGWILEVNKVTRKIIEGVGGVANKVHRIYEKPL